MSTLQHLQELDPNQLTSFHLDEPALAGDSENVITKLFNKVKSVVGPEHPGSQPQDKINPTSQRTGEGNVSSDRSPISVKSSSLHGSVSLARDDISVTDSVHSVSTLPADMSRPSQVKASDLLSSFLSDRNLLADKPPVTSMPDLSKDFPLDDSTDYSSTSSKTSLDRQEDEAEVKDEVEGDMTRVISDNDKPAVAGDRSLQFVEPEQPTKPLQLERTISKDSDSQSIATTFSVSNTNSLRNVISRLRGHKSDKEFWMPDENCKECYTCRKTFTFLRRKHHCRICGQIFCGKCASHIIAGKQFKQKGEVRVCNFCFENIDSDIVENNSAISIGSIPVDSATIGSFSPVVPDQKAPVAAPKLQISTTALKQSRDSYGAQDTPTVAVEFQDEFGTVGADNMEPAKALDLLSLTDNPIVRQRHRLSVYDEHEPRPTRTESTSSIRPRMRASTNGSQGSSEERHDFASFTQKSPFPFRSEIASPALEAVPNRAGSDYGGSPLIDKYDEDNDDSSVLWSNVKSPHVGDLPANAFGTYKLHEPGSPSLSANDLKAYEGSPSDRGTLNMHYESGTIAKHKMSRRFSNSVHGRRASHNKRGPIWRNMKNVRVNTQEFPKSYRESRTSEDAVSMDSQFMLFSPFSRTETLTWPTADGLGLTNSLPTSQSLQLASPSLQMHSELSIASLDHLKKLLHHSLANLKYMQEHPTVLLQYENIIFDLLLEMVACIKLDIRGGDDMDLRHYIKIKKIPGGLPSDSHYMKGVVCSKNVAHKQMIRNVDNPTILILLFPVEYSRVGNQLLSLEPVLSQEKEHLKKLVARIIALKPSIVLTKFNVSRLALEYLLAANIIVVHNMKKSGLQAIARCTGASLIPSIDKFTSGELSLGHCGKFEIKTLVHDMIPNRRKTYLKFDQCSPDLGGTIVLRGADQATLSSIKHIVDFMCYVAHSSKLETFLLRDSFAKSKTRADTSNIEPNMDGSTLRNTSDSLSTLSSFSNSELGNANYPSSNPTITVDSADVGLESRSILSGLGITETEERYRSIDGSIELYKEAIVSISPFVVIPPPYLLTKIKETELKILNMERLRALDETQHERVITPTFDASPESNPATQVIVHVDAVTSPLKDELDLLLDQRHQLTRAWYASMPDMFSHLTAYHHQHLIVLYFNVCTATTVPCHGPEPLFFQYYNQTSDITLGHYLEDLCWNAKRKCSSSMCERPEMLHYRSYVHGQARINVMIEEFECPQPGMTDIILMWSYCKRCNNPTPVVPMSQNTWSYSFGKFLELSLYQTDVQCRADICPHDIARDHVRYFGFKNLAVRFQYDEIDLLEVAPPPMKLVMFTNVHSKLREAQYQNYRTKITSFYHSITERNKHFNLDVIDPAKVDSAKKELAEMSETAAAEKKAMLQALQSIYATTYSTDILSLNQIVFHLVRIASVWDQTYSNLLRRYLPQDTDLGKIASSSLKKLLPADKVIDMDARAERAIGTEDLPVLDVGLDSLPMSIASDEQFNIPDDDDRLDTVPSLCSSPSAYAMSSNNEKHGGTTQNEDIVLPAQLSRRMSLELIRSEAQRVAEVENRSNTSTSPLPLVDPAASSIISRRQAKFVAKQSAPGGDGKSKPSLIPGLLTLAEHGAGNSIRRKEHPIFSVIKDYPLSVATPGSDPTNQMGTNNLSTNSLAKLHRESSSKSIPIAPPGANADGVSRSQYSYLPRYVDQLHKRSTPSMRDIPNAGAGRRKWGHKLKHSRTSIQVYDTAKDLVEDVEQEFGEDLTPRSSTFISLTDGRTFPSGFGKIDQLQPHRIPPAGHIYRRIEPRRDYFDTIASTVHNDGLGRIVNIPSSPSSITNFSPEAIPIEQHLPDRNQEAPLSSSPTLLPIREMESSEDTDVLPLETEQNNSPSSQKEMSQLLHGPSVGSDQTMFMKALSTALAEITFSKLPALEYPFTQTDHIFPDSLVIVKEDVPSTIIAYTLSCEDYLEKLHAIHDGNDENSQSTIVPYTLEHQHADWLDLATTKETHSSSHASGMEKALLSDTGTHMRYQFSDGSTRFFCKVFFSEQFEALRQNCGCSEKYITSLASSVEWDSSGGKSGSAFLKTTDDRFLIKQMSRYEMDAFLRFAPAYFQYMSEAFFHELPTVLAKIFGFYSIGYKNSATGKSMRMDVLIMENLFYQRNIFDLKGSMRNRHVRSTGKHNEVLLDENLVEFIYQSPLFIRSHAKETLRGSLHNDTLFLSRLDVMDYSLLVGIDEEEQELVVGIVDFMRTFTWDKKLESWVKESGILGGGGKEPTIVSPKTYRIRFREAMERYFLMVPDFWASVGQTTIGQQHDHQ